MSPAAYLRALQATRSPGLVREFQRLSRETPPQTLTDLDALLSRAEASILATVSRQFSWRPFTV